MDSDVGVSVYTEAKQEYTKQLTLFLSPVLHKTFLTILKQAQEDEANPKRHLWKFQELLSQIPDWNIDKVQRETSRIATETNCDYLEDLVTAVFIAHTKVLTAIRLSNKNKKVQITIPKLDHFLHRALSETSRVLWSSAYLFQSDVAPIEKQKNHQQVASLIETGIAQAIRGLLPVKNILKDCFNEIAGEEEEGEEETVEESHVPEAPVEVPVEEKLVEHRVEEKAIEAPVEEKVIEPPVEVPLELPPVEEKPVEPPVEVPLELPPVEEKVVEEVSTPAPVPQTIVVDTEPTVRFTDFDQVFQPGPQGEVKMSYTPAQPPDEDMDEQPVFVDDHMSDVSDFEVIGDEKPTEMGADDYEVLG